MGIEDIELVNIAVIGSTLLTYKLLCELEDIQRPKYVFGLPDNLLHNKANSVRLDNFCYSKGVILDKSNDWNSLGRHCERLKIDTILEFGDSRIIPDSITSRYRVIGNHGAALPCVQGAASLVWGRLLNSGEWGVSLFELDGGIDSGDILCTSKFEYDDSITIKDFVEAADHLTISMFLGVVDGGYRRKKNSRWNVRVSRGTDAFVAVSLLKAALQIGANIYMPPRSPVDGRLEENWPTEFQRVFKLANDSPYPKWY